MALFIVSQTFFVVGPLCGAFTALNGFVPRELSRGTKEPVGKIPPPRPSVTQITARHLGIYLAKHHQQGRICKGFAYRFGHRRLPGGASRVIRVEPGSFGASADQDDAMTP
ncbi:hypothetical protein GCM10017559_68410 [Streptosporangium longisporum]|uniref:Secreted protein n=1 Tax=Streptosporangium longisporum TaxID=46187 RepID=A0ABP6L3W0_9ACTN